MDAKGFIVQSAPGFNGHLNDATVYRYMRKLPMPAGLKIMADNGFSMRGDVITPMVNGRPDRGPIKRLFHTFTANYYYLTTCIHCY